MRTLIRALAACAAALTIAACGGDPAPGNTSTSGNSSAPPAAGAPADPAAAPEMVSGTVTGFAKTITVDGVDYGTAGAASVALDIDPRAETAATMADVKIGQQVDVALDAGGNVTKVSVRATALGPVEAVDATKNTLKVVGQTINVVTTGDAKTVFEGVDALDKIKVGDWVEVHGTLNTAGEIVATRVEVKPAAGTIAVRLGGLVKNLTDTAATKTFKLGDLTVNFANAVVKPDGAKLANDQFVFVYADTLPVNGTLAAKAVQVLKAPTLDGRRVGIGGLVTAVADGGKKLKVNGLDVDASAAEIKGGQKPTLADIALLDMVRVEGTLSVTNGVPVLKAARLWVIPASEQRRIVLAGQISGYTAADKPFAVRGVPVKVDASTRYKGGAVKDLANNAFVLMKGRIDGAAVLADEIVFDVPPRGVDLRLFGVVSGYDAAKGEFKLLGIPMVLAPNAVFEGGSKADFANDKLVQVRGSWNGTAFFVTKVEFSAATLAPAVYLEGVLKQLDTAARKFTLNGTAVKYDDKTEIENGPLANDKRVAVKAQLVGADVVAREIEVEVPMAGARLMGPVTAVSAADKTFVVRGQTVTWSATTVFKGGVAADLSAGDFVKVEATLAAGKVNAVVVTFLKP
jgi:hypothetical protein